jgi:hypothetical protein
MSVFTSVKVYTSIFLNPKEPVVGAPFNQTLVDDEKPESICTDVK